MPRKSLILASLLMGLAAMPQTRANTPSETMVTIQNGTLEGIREPNSNIRSFKGVPFAAPPVGDLRWHPPTPVTNWDGVRPAKAFGPRAMQLPVFGDMQFRSNGMSEDCLYLNVWTPAESKEARLPVLLYFYGGGFIAGDGSEPRYDGQSVAEHGIVTVTANYRLGVFGFLAHPELTAESPHHASGNYGLLDQVAALSWVRNNIAAFGGDPERITIAGESAGSISVSALMASPLSRDMIAGAIGESGSILETLAPAPLETAEALGRRIAAGLGIGEAPSLEQLRAMPAQQLMETARDAGFQWFSPTLDGYFFPQPPEAIFTAGEQAKVPLLAGVNSQEMGFAALLGNQAPTVENYKQALKRIYPEHSDAVFIAYPATNPDEVMDAAQDLASDRFISFGTWKWIDLATKTGGQPTFYYLYAHPRPAMRPELGKVAPGFAGGIVETEEPRPRDRGAVHSAEIEYALGNLHLNKVFAWNEEDEQVSRLMQSYFIRFIQTGNPNGPDLPEWPRFDTGLRLVIDSATHTQSLDPLRARYDLLERIKQTD